MTLADRFIPIIPIHQKMLERLIEQRKTDPYGAVGWAEPYAAFASSITISRDDLYRPLLERGLVEDCQIAMSDRAGRFFVRITDAGIKCAALGMMMKAPIVASSYDLVALESGSCAREGCKHLIALHAGHTGKCSMRECECIGVVIDGQD